MFHYLHNLHNKVVRYDIYNQVNIYKILCRSEVTAKRTDSLWWRDILKVGGLEGDLWFSAEVSSVLGDGNSIGFWLEKWIGNNSLKEMYPNLFVLEYIKICINFILYLLRKYI